MNKTYLTLIAITIALSAQIYEDAEDGKTTGWNIIDKKPLGANIENIDLTTNKVIEFQESSKRDVFILGSKNKKNGWNDVDNDTLTWKMNFSEKFIIYIPVSTSNGRRYMVYTPISKSKGLRRKFIQIGLGEDFADASWKTVRRNIANDLQHFEPANKLIAINGFIIRGSGQLDDIETSSSKVEDEKKDENEAIDLSKIIEGVGSNYISIRSVDIRIFSIIGKSFQIEYGTDKNLGTFSEKVELSNDGHPNFLLYNTIRNLKENTKYFYRVNVVTRDGNNVSTEIKSFTTLKGNPNLDNGVKLAIKSTEVKALEFRSAKLKFNFTIPIKEFHLKYGEGNKLDKAIAKQVFLNTASVEETITALQPNTEYSYRVEAIDRNDNFFISPIMTFRTKAVPDNIPYKLKALYIFTNSINASFSGTVSAEIQFTKDKSFNDFIVLEGKFLERQETQFISAEFKTEPETRYYYRTKAIDTNGEEHFSEIKTFKTIY